MAKDTGKSTNIKPARSSRQPRATAPMSFINENEEYEDEIEDGEEVEDDAVPVDMLTIIQEFQKRKAKKSTSNAETFQSQKASLYARSRQEAYDMVKDGNAYLDDALENMKQLDNQGGSYKKIMKDFLPLYNANDSSIQALLDTYPNLLQDLGPRRAQESDAASKMLLSMPIAREKSRKQLMKQARAQIDEGLENQRVATDAQALIKHYKALLRT